MWRSQTRVGKNDRLDAGGLGADQMSELTGRGVLSGSEPIVLHGTSTTTVLAFWRWALSDVLSNTARGLLAEFFVACDLGVTDSLRVEWAPFDLTSRGGIRVEVKSAAYLQRWTQKRMTSPTFSVTPTRYWDQDVGDFIGERKRHAEVYVFCLHAHKERATLNPLDVRQWQFYVAPTTLLDTHLGTQKTVRLATLQRLGITEVAYGAIDSVITRLVDLSGRAFPATQD